MFREIKSSPSTSVRIARCAAKLDVTHTYTPPPAHPFQNIQCQIAKFRGLLANMLPHDQTNKTVKQATRAQAPEARSGYRPFPNALSISFNNRLGKRIELVVDKTLGLPWCPEFGGLAPHQRHKSALSVSPLLLRHCPLLTKVKM